MTLPKSIFIQGRFKELRIGQACDFYPFTAGSAARFLELEKTSLSPVLVVLSSKDALCHFMSLP